MPLEIANGTVKLRLLGYGELKAGEAERGAATWAIPAEAREKVPGCYAWVFRLEKQGS